MNLNAPEVRARIAAAEAAADEAFWAVIVERFPESLSGDVEPLFVSHRRENNTDDIRYWLHWNVPGLSDGEPYNGSAASRC